MEICGRDGFRTSKAKARKMVSAAYSAPTANYVKASNTMG